MTYFDHPYASNSSLKELVSRHNGQVKPDNLQAIFDFGTEFHAGILERHKMRVDAITTEQKQLVDDMAKTFWKDDLCRQIAMQPDFKREHEFYRANRFGIGAKCKCDGISKKLRIILELKGLSISTENAFKEGILHLGYDQGAAWYLNVASSRSRPDGVCWGSHFDYKLIVGISKTYPDRLFKLLIDRKHAYYRHGMQKVHSAVYLWKDVYGFN